MKKIAIIGANSYIARNLYYVLKESNIKCQVKLYDYANSHLDGGADYKKICILDRKSVEEIDFDCDIMFMFVGKTGSVEGFEQYSDFIDINEKSLLNILDEYRKRKAYAKVVFPSTRLIYKGKQEAQKEDAEKEFKTVYAINKYACEQYLRQYHQIFDVQYCIFRICIPYGTLVPKASAYGTVEFMLEKARNGENITLYGDGSARRTLTYIKDLCNAMILGAFSEKCKNDVYNIGGENYSLKQMAELIALKYMINIDYIDWPDIAKKIESGDTVFDDGKLKSCIGNLTVNKFGEWVETIK